ncbi:hypothetical protein [Paraburkholderia sp. BCC1885]|nr:hypothetical protein [Paraburkholderia sp. BCC1885]
MFSIDHRLGHATITPDYDYRVASRWQVAGGRYMTGQEAEDTRQRRNRRK